MLHRTEASGWGLFAALLFVAALQGGCLTWKPGYTVAIEPSGEGADAAAGALREAAALEETAETRDEVLALVALAERAVAAAPDDYDALFKVGEYATLMGAAHSTTRAEKKRWYVAGIQSLERALYTDPGFRAAVDAGELFDVAVTRLGPERVEAMFFWTQAVNYTFKECLTPAQIPLHVEWIVQTRKNLEQLEALDPAFRGGALHFSWAIYYLGLPERYGGDMALSADYFEQGMAISPQSVLFRWGRAKYWRVKARDREGFVEDLEWVLAQDPDASPNTTHPWSVYMQRDAEQMLDRVERYF